MTKITSPVPHSSATLSKGARQSKHVQAAGDAAKQQFVSAAVRMGWQLAIVVLVPIIVGAELDKDLGTKFLTFIGLGLALLGSALVMWRAMQAANKLPVAKLSAAEKRAIQKSYEEDDND